MTPANLSLVCAARLHLYLDFHTIFISEYQTFVGMYCHIVDHHIAKTVEKVMSSRSSFSGASRQIPIVLLWIFCRPFLFLKAIKTLGPLMYWQIYTFENNPNVYIILAVVPTSTNITTL